MNKPIQPKIVFLDLETSYNTVTCWRTGEQYIGPEQILRERQIICATWNWEHEGNKVHQLDWGITKQDDYALCKKLQKELAKADVIIGQNSDKFDIKYLRGRLFYHKLPNLGCLATLDTLKLSRSAFNLNSYKLDYVLKYMKVKGKLKTDLDLWKKIIEHKDLKALLYMLKYNTKDVIDTKRYFNRIREYVKLPVHLGVVMGGHRDDCPNCASSDIRKEGKVILTSGIAYQRYSCNTCRHWFRGGKIK